VGALEVVVRRELCEESMKVALVHDEHVVETL
jgi:hypothetical protein